MSYENERKCLPSNDFLPMILFAQTGMQSHTLFPLIEFIISLKELPLECDSAVDVINYHGIHTSQHDRHPCHL